MQILEKDIVLENDRVLLRPLQQSDTDNLLEFSLNDPDIWKFSTIPAQGRENLDNYIRLAIENRAKGTEYPFIIFDKLSGRYAGSTRFYDIQPMHKTLQLGYTWIGSQYQRTGLNRNCKLLLLDFAFRELLVERVEFRANNENKKSISAMLAIGCVVDGILRSNMQNPDGTRRDSIILSILRNEWENGVRSTLETKLG